jgi:hypothetical protein
LPLQGFEKRSFDESRLRLSPTFMELPCSAKSDCDDSSPFGSRLPPRRFSRPRGLKTVTASKAFAFDTFHELRLPFKATGNAIVEALASTPLLGFLSLPATCAVRSTYPGVQPGSFRLRGFALLDGLLPRPRCRSCDRRRSGFAGEKRPHSLELYAFRRLCPHAALYRFLLL